jgi:hypothetical protein
VARRNASSLSSHLIAFRASHSRRFAWDASIISRKRCRKTSQTIGIIRNLEFLLLNYGGRDGLDEWVRTEMKEHLESGRLVYYHSPEQQRFSLRSREEYGDASGDRRVAVQRRRGQQDRSPFRLSCRAAAAGV